ncbi:hypothetical protein RND81_13G048300 [Saponaria officinalis]|uniref:Transposase n=1 Tax=Saponaria officinalis TaxID=3572 RepID=A0AAW1GZL7_SAPOF
MSQGRKRSQADMPTVVSNKYEQQRLLNIQDNKRRLESMNIKHISASLSSLVDSTMEKKRKGKACEKNTKLDAAKKKKQVEMKGSKRGIYIQPQLLANLLKMSNRQQTELIGDDELRSISTATKVVKEAICSEQQISSSEDNEDIDNDDDIDNEEFDRFMVMERENNGHIYNGDDELIQVKDIENTLQNVAGKKPSGDDDFEIENILQNLARKRSIGDDDFEIENTLQNLAGKRSNVDDDFEIENTLQNLAEKGSSGDVGFGNESECYANGDKEMIIVDNELITQGKVKKTRGHVYCKKLTELAPGEKVFIEFNEDGIPIGDYSTTFSYFIGEQVRNQSVCPVQVSKWEDYTSETLDHLWRCILEKCDFDNPDLRKEGIMKHARELFRDSRHKLRRKYIIEPNFTTKEDQLKNKPKDMLKADWKYLVELWRTPKFQEKSEKAKRSRSFQKMPHYTGSKSHARVKEDIRKKNGGKCSRVDMLLETRQRTSDKSVNSTNLACNMHAIDGVKRLKKEREEGLNQKTDEQILAEVLGKDSRGYLRCYGRGKSITQYFGVKPSRLDLANEVMLVKRATTDTLEEAKKELEAANKNVEEARKVAEAARKEA